MISIKSLKDEVNQYDELIEVALITDEKGKEQKIEFYPLFKYEKIRKLVLEIGHFFMNAQKEKITIDSLEEDAIIDYFIIRHFSKGLKFTTGKKAKTLYDEFKIVYNSKLYKLFKNEIFSSDLVEKSKEEVYKEIFNNIELSAKFEKRLNEAQETIKNLPLENREILNNLNKNIEKEGD